MAITNESSNSTFVEAGGLQVMVRPRMLGKAAVTACALVLSVLAPATASGHGPATLEQPLGLGEVGPAVPWSPVWLQAPPATRIVGLAAQHKPGMLEAKRQQPLAAISPPPPWDPSQYDGKTLTADAPDVTTLPTVHTVYLYPKDGVNRFSQFAAMFQRDARAASNVLTTFHGRGIRFDERLGDDRATRYLDITVVRGKNTTSKLSDPNRQFWLVRDELAAKGLANNNKKYLVWLDAGSTWCGQGELKQDARRSSANYSETRTLGVVYRHNAPANADTGGFCGYWTVLHELGHNMGAVQSAAPNYNADNAGHCNDYGGDVMCAAPVTKPYSSASGFYFDYGLDDYWDPAADPASGSIAKLPWWTVNLSKFLCPLTGCEFASEPGY